MMQKAADVRIVMHDDTVITLGQWDASRSGRFGSLEQAHRRLWRVAVYVDPGADVRQKRLVRAAAQDRFGKSSRYQPDPHRSQYLEEVFAQAADTEGWQIEDRDALSDAAFTPTEPTSRADALEFVRGLITARRASVAETSGAGRQSKLPLSSDSGP